MRIRVLLSNARRKPTAVNSSAPDRVSPGANKLTIGGAAGFAHLTFRARTGGVWYGLHRPKYSGPSGRIVPAGSFRQVSEDWSGISSKVKETLVFFLFFFEFMKVRFVDRNNFAWNRSFSQGHDGEK